MTLLERLGGREAITRGIVHTFRILSRRPRPSRHEEAAGEELDAYLRGLGLSPVRDGAGNRMADVPPAPGRASAPRLILQGHLDMVCEKDASCTKNMETEGLDLAVDGDYVYAKGTTLGGDDGIAVAMALAILDAQDIPHPHLEAVFTVDEEIGMLGAVSMDVSPLKGKKLLNLDSEVEGVFTVSCAGGNVTNCFLPVVRAPFEGTALTVTVSGLQGGHSGVEIHKGRANANMLLGRVLQAMDQAAPLRLVSAQGGMKDNAIPTLSSAQVVVSDEQPARAAAEAMAAAFAGEFRVTDPKVAVTLEPCQLELAPMDQDFTQKAICMLTCLPNGVQVMSADIPGLVQTSLNLGVLATGEEEMRASFCVRSSVESQKVMLVGRLSALMKQLCGRIEVFGDYSSWEYLADSPLRELMTEVYREQYGKEPSIEAIHAGVECGIFSGKLPGLDCVSIGPDLLEIHTPRERMSISSVQRVWKFVLEVLKRSK